ncbi:MAG: hypothetical protein NUV68_03835 [Caldiserica bacterium]|jgi:hypothetical protein|nr:hypothetical protein [Caldisericota bacterium]
MGTFGHWGGYLKIPKESNSFKSSKQKPEGKESVSKNHKGGSGSWGNYL